MYYLLILIALIEAINILSSVLFGIYLNQELTYSLFVIQSLHKLLSMQLIAADLLSRIEPISINGNQVHDDRYANTAVSFCTNES